MTSVPHTPGPWTAEIEEHKAPSEWFSANVYSGEALSGTYRSVARIPEPDPVWDSERSAEVEANARLIAAAPEMLAALESVYQDLVDYSKRLSGAYDTGAIALGSSADQVAAVIAKAKGQRS